MSLAQVLSTYFVLNILLCLAYIILRLYASMQAKLNRFSSANSDLKLHYFAIAGIYALVAAHPLLPKREFIRPAAKVWSAPSINSFAQDFSVSGKAGYFAFSTNSGTKSIGADKVSITLAMLLFVIVACGLAYIIRDLRALRRIKRHSFLVKNIGRVTISVNDQILVPFSYWLPGHAEIVVPNTFLKNPSDYRMAIAHELQHHRSGDTQWVYILWCLRILCIMNPFIHLWSRLISELQEFACDETLIGRNRVESRQYARCLIEVAQTAINQKYVPACATGLTFLVEGNLLKRRVERMFSNTKMKIGRSINIGVAGLLVALLTATAFASQGMVQDRRVTMADAEKMAARAQSDSDFPVVVNDLVLNQLNRYIGTPEGRDFMRATLQRMENHRSLVEEKIHSYQVPLELLAVPITESGYENYSQKGGAKAAGIWMFIKSTAKNFGLRVNDQVDERLNLDLETDAAMRYLKAEKLRFKDWLLAIQSYNMGDKKLQEGISKTGSRDAWTLIRHGYEGDKDYLPKVMAAVLIMRSPESVQ